ncbi:cytochrome P450 monooxygenase [Multifurca ochricompacta]|uniref:Cytochrome P450 monooxygenase n=1 Tax=Multifurca ochricompacta TaxID=376703 RepID=A0AAD4QMJ5_9AGAM|nr:cytochrome P450 monooxygenase [Multifurca ochricompacta]
MLTLEPFRLHLRACSLNECLLILVVFTLLFFRWFPTRRLKLPPGPRPDPFIGNLRHMSLKKQELRFTEWGRIFGDVVYFKIFGRPMIVLNTLQTAQDLMEKRSLNYSCRPRFVLLVEMMGWDASLPQLPYGPRFRKQRRLILEHFTKGVSSFRPTQRRETYILLRGLLESPGAFLQHVRRFAAGTIMKITYGHTVCSTDELYVRLAEEAGTDTVTSGSPGSMLVDFFPALKHIPTWLPGAGFKRHALRTRIKVRNMHDAPYDMAAGTATPSFTSRLISDNIAAGGKCPIHDEEDIKGVAGTLYGAAADTTSATLATFFLAMILHPEVFAKAQAEIDRVVGPDRLPDFQDRSSLPYVESIVKEVYRWHCPVPLAVPHRSMNDDQYRGYDIPADTVIIPNVWAMTRDEKMYPEADSFNPERFMNQDESGREQTDPKDFIFGFGRRECPGKTFADANVWLVSACIIAAFQAPVSRNESGEKVVPQAKFTSGFVRHPEPFECDIKPRSPRYSGLIRQATNSTLH